MNRKTKKLIYINYVNKMRLKGFKKPKWTLKNKRKWWPYIWINHTPNLYEEVWICDMGFR
jgi:hypothetical protein